MGKYFLFISEAIFLTSLMSLSVAPTHKKKQAFLVVVLHNMPAGYVILIGIWLCCYLKKKRDLWLTKRERETGPEVSVELQTDFNEKKWSSFKRESHR